MEKSEKTTENPENKQEQNSEGEEKQTKKPPLTRFRQQNLKAWQPILTPRPVIITFFALGIIFLPLGIVLLITSNNVLEYSVQYDNACELEQDPCLVSITVDSKMSAPVYLYYGLQNYYQNHRRYVASRNDQQLRGENIDVSDLTACDPRQSNNSANTNDQLYYPCGLIAWSMFNDTFTMSYSNGTLVTLRKEGIAWNSDKSTKFKNPPPDTPGIRVIEDLQDEDFIVWMRTAALPNFKKLYRIIDTDIQPGTYTFDIENNYPVSSFDGKKIFDFEHNELDWRKKSFPRNCLYCCWIDLFTSSDCFFDKTFDFS